MELILLKDYKPHSRLLKAGTPIGVTNSVGLELIKKGIARDVTKEYLADIIKKREEDANPLQEVEPSEEEVATKEIKKEKK